jgi:hypothetical protein
VGVLKDLAVGGRNELRGIFLQVAPWANRQRNGPDFAARTRREKRGVHVHHFGAAFRTLNPRRLCAQFVKEGCYICAEICVGGGHAPKATALPKKGLVNIAHVCAVAYTTPKWVPECHPRKKSPRSRLRSSGSNNSAGIAPIAAFGNGSRLGSKQRKRNWNPNTQNASAARETTPSFVTLSAGYLILQAHR